MKKIEIKKFKTTPDLAKMIEEGHKVHAMANGRIQSYERHTPQPEDYSNLDDFMEVAENHIDELYSTRKEVDEMLTEVFTVFVKHPELSGTPYIAVLELMVFLEEDFRQLTKRYEAASSALAAMEENQYGCDDMEYLVNTSEQKGTVTVKAHGNTYHVPIGIFDNRVDKTSFLRAEPSAWDAALVEDVTCAIRQATDTMWAGYRK